MTKLTIKTEVLDTHKHLITEDEFDRLVRKTITYTESPAHTNARLFMRYIADETQSVVTESNNEYTFTYIGF